MDTTNSLGTAATANIPFAPAPACPICRASSSRPIERKEDFGLHLTYVCCDGCGLVSMDPRPTSEGMLAFYEGQYWDELSSVSAGVSDKQASVGRHQLWFARRHLDLAQVRTVLEIGSSHGQTLATFRRAIGHTASVYGIEPSATARKNSLLACPGIELVGKSYGDLAFTSLSFDLIIISHVLEHLDDPVKALQLLRSRLSPTGMILVEVPNFYGHPSAQLAHNFLFTPQSFANCISSAGLRAEATRISDRATERNPVYIMALLTPGESRRASESFEQVQAGRNHMPAVWNRYVREQRTITARVKSKISALTRRLSGAL
jgi:SAM-dependent methyltransferase